MKDVVLKRNSARRLAMPSNGCDKEHNIEIVNGNRLRRNTEDRLNLDIIKSLLHSSVPQEVTQREIIIDCSSGSKKMLLSPERSNFDNDSGNDRIFLPIMPSVASCSSPPSSSNSQRSSPSSLAYAGAKFNASPSPKILPKPPSHWVTSSPKLTDCGAIENVLKVMLRVEC